jgi:hypothetical protein
MEMLLILKYTVLFVDNDLIKDIEESELEAVMTRRKKVVQTENSYEKPKFTVRSVSKRISNTEDEEDGEFVLFLLDNTMDYF